MTPLCAATHGMPLELLAHLLALGCYRAAHVQLPPLLVQGSHVRGEPLISEAQPGRHVLEGDRAQHMQRER
jgi:hypothetical protein